MADAQAPRAGHAGMSAAHRDTVDRPLDDTCQ